MSNVVTLSDVLSWFVLLFGAITGAGAKLAWMLFGVSNIPPRDPDEYRAWAMKRRWLIVSEISALPLFATVALMVGKLQAWPLEAVVLFSMAMGALGFAFFLDALQTIIKRNINRG